MAFRFGHADEAFLFQRSNVGLNRINDRITAEEFSDFLPAARNFEKMQYSHAVFSDNRSAAVQQAVQSFQTGVFKLTI